MILYRVTTSDNQLYDITDFNPDNYFAVGEVIEQRIKIRSYKGGNGAAYYSVSIDRGPNDGPGEEF